MPRKSRCQHCDRSVNFEQFFPMLNLTCPDCGCLHETRVCSQCREEAKTIVAALEAATLAAGGDGGDEARN